MRCFSPTKLTIFLNFLSYPVFVTFFPVILRVFLYFDFKLKSNTLLLADTPPPFLILRGPFVENPEYLSYKVSHILDVADCDLVLYNMLFYSLSFL